MRPAVAGIAVSLVALVAGSGGQKPEPTFRTSDRCIACHNGLVTPKGEDVSIGFEWRASVMANSSRDPYWQASVRREVMDHSESRAHIEDECSICHMPITRYEAKLRGARGEVFSHLPFDTSRGGKEAADGVTCSVCHQITKEQLGTRASFNGGFVVNGPSPGGEHPEYGPFQIDRGLQRVMRSSTGGFEPVENTDHIRKSELCATCHTLYTAALGPGGKAIGELPEQMPYQEWLHSSYRTKQTCQDCHMPEVKEPTPIARVLGVPREGMSQHVFVGGNFFLQGLLNRFRNELQVAALSQELTSAAEGTVEFLKSRAARLSIVEVRLAAGKLEAQLRVENLGGHKLPTAFPSRRAWLHVTVHDASGRAVFESGAVHPDGSIAGNDNDADPGRFEPHYEEIASSGQVQIYEDIIGDQSNRVTTGLLSGVGYLKDNRLLPHGFDKRTAAPDIAVMGDAAADPDFTDGSDRVRYAIPVRAGTGPFRVEAELWYQPIGYRWANNLKRYQAAEPGRFNRYYDSMGSTTGVVLARAVAFQ